MSLMTTISINNRRYFILAILFFFEMGQPCPTLITRHHIHRIGNILTHSLVPLWTGTTTTINPLPFFGAFFFATVAADQGSLGTTGLGLDISWMAVARTACIGSFDSGYKTSRRVVYL